MHIQRLEIEGFKTFARKTIIQFEKGISGVVGSNGSGKSNVVDAIKWVLGEQSAKSLRGQAMEDVIFMGAEGVEPAKFAKVSLVFSRGEETFPGLFASLDEVEISRRLKRSGSSSYYINRSRVRLRDVQNFFLDTGLSNKKYAVIEQGQIGNIVTATPNQMRALFEEAAGISRFKIQKEGAESKLVSTRENLVTVSVIVDGLEKRLTSLEKQAKKAIRHRRLSSVLGQLERAISLSVYKGLLDDRKVQAITYKKSLQEEEAAAQSLKRQWNMLAQAKQSLSARQEQNTLLQKKANQLSADFLESTARLKYQRKETDDLKERIQSLQEEEQRAQSQLLQGKVDVDRQKEKLDRADLQMREASATRAKIVDSHDKATKEIRELDRQIDAHKEKGDRYIRERNKLSGERIALKQRLEDIDRDLRQRGGEVQEIEEQVSQKKAEQTALEAEKQSAKYELKETREKEVSSKEIREQLRGKLREASEERRAVQQRHQMQYRKLVDCETRLSSLQRLALQHEGVPKDIRRVLQHEQAIGVLAEMLVVPKEKEELLLTALGEKIDVVLVADPEAMDELAALGKGRVQLLALSQDQIPLGYFDDISGDERGRRALGQLLGTVVEAEHFLETQDKEGRFILPEHRAFVERGLLQKGAPKSSASEILDRRRRILRLETQLQNEKRVLEDCEKEEQQALAVEKEQKIRLREAEQAVEQIATIVKEQKAAIEQIRSQLRISQSEERRLLGQVEHQKKYHQRLSQEQQERQSRLKEIEERQGFLQQSVEENEVSTRKIQDQRYKAYQLAKRLSQQRNDLNITCGTLGERLSQTKETYHRFKNSLHQYQQALERVEAQRISSQERRHSLLEDNLVLQENAESLEKKQLQAQEELEQSLKGVEKWRHHIEQLDVSFQKEQEIKNLLSQRRVEDLHVLEAIKEKIQEQCQQMMRKHQVDLITLLPRLERDGSMLFPPLDGVLAMDPETEQDKELSQSFFLSLTDLDAQDVLQRWKEQTAIFEAERSQLGNINFMAIQERLEIKEEFDLVVAQRNDLELSMTQIQDSISQLEDICSSRFLETIQEADRHFQDIYPKLLGGGASKIELEEPSLPLDTGVRVWANPPGKKMKILSLLSGGEKAQVAIALLFALFRIKPSPLCLMDEVDAPLDVANGERFNTMLREMSQDSQFIIITHNKKTIEAVDLLYGVTIVSGVSQLVSVSID